MFLWHSLAAFLSARANLDAVWALPIIALEGGFLVSAHQLLRDPKASTAREVKDRMNALMPALVFIVAIAAI